MQIKLPENATEQEIIDTCLDIINATDEQTDIPENIRGSIKRMCTAYFEACIKAAKKEFVPYVGLVFLTLGYRDALVIFGKASTKTE